MKQPESSRSEVGRVKSRRGATVILARDGTVYRVIRKASQVDSLPTLLEYMRDVDGFLDRQQGLTQRQHTVARALAKALYRRALARHLRIDVEDTVQEAVSRAKAELNRKRPATVKRSTYAYESESTAWSRRSRKETPE